MYIMTFVKFTSFFFRIDSLLSNLGQYYVAPWMRMQPYLVGAIIGFVMHKLKDLKIKRPKYFVESYWTITIPIFLLTLFITYFKNISYVFFAITFSVGRFCLSLFLGSMVIMCHLGYGGLINRILSSKIFVHLNKLTYLMFLLNPFFITLIEAGRSSSSHYDTATVSFLFQPIICIRNYCCILFLVINNICRHTNHVHCISIKFSNIRDTFPTIIG